MKIRSVRSGDIDHVGAVHVRSWQETYRGLLPPSVIDSYTAEKRAAQWQSALTDPTRTVIVAEDNNTIVGFAAGGPARDKMVPYRAEIYALYVLRQTQRQGYGSALFQALTVRLRAPMYLWVLATNESACQFYAKLGGVIIARKQDSYGDFCVEELAYGWGK